MLELIRILLSITLSLSWIQDYPDLIIIAADDRLSQTDKRLSVSDKENILLKKIDHGRPKCSQTQPGKCSTYVEVLSLRPKYSQTQENVVHMYKYYPQR